MCSWAHQPSFELELQKICQRFPGCTRIFTLFLERHPFNHLSQLREPHGHRHFVLHQFNTGNRVCTSWHYILLWQCLPLSPTWFVMSDYRRVGTSGPGFHFSMTTAESKLGLLPRRQDEKTSCITQFSKGTLGNFISYKHAKSKGMWFSVLVMTE